MTSPAWTAAPFLALDTETTGVDTTTDRIVTAVLLHIHGATVRTHTWLTDTDGVDIPAEATAIHGITTEHAHHAGQPAADAVAELDTTLAGYWHPDVPLIVYNARFDLSILDAELRRHHHTGLTIAGPVVDPLVIDRAYDRYRKGSRKLADVAAHHGIHLSERDAHTAESDALTAARLAWKLVRAHSQLRGMPLPDLHRWQAKWHAEQQHSFAKYLRAKIIPKVEGETTGLVGDELQAKLDDLADLRRRADNIDATADDWPTTGGPA